MDNYSTKLQELFKLLAKERKKSINTAIIRKSELGDHHFGTR